MDIRNVYHTIKEPKISGRYIPFSVIEELLSDLSNFAKVSSVGISENGVSIKSVEVGTGSKRVLGWSQMHGNETTTTKALFDFFRLLKNNANSSTVKSFLETYTFYVIPVLNPDGALLYTRENANNIDLNRDAVLQSQAESKVLWNVFKEFQPDMCLNLHDQRSIYGLPNNNPATLSFLSPSADDKRTITASRLDAMKAIVSMNGILQEIIPGKVGRYDDGFNINCFGDSFQAEGVATILFEAGHYLNDYDRERTREFLFYALCTLFELLQPELETNNVIESYMSIPENKKNYRDIILQNVMLQGKQTDIALQFEENLVNSSIEFLAKVDKIGGLKDLFGHKEIDLGGKEILINSHENVFENMNVSTILEKKSKKTIII